MLTIAKLLVAIYCACAVVTKQPDEEEDEDEDEEEEPTQEAEIGTDDRKTLLKLDKPLAGIF